MRKTILCFASFLTPVTTATAHAATIQLGFINTNDCAHAKAEISLLNTANAQVNTVCSPPGRYTSDNGQTYNYRLYTTVTVPGTIVLNTPITLASIDTDNPSYAKSEVELLNCGSARINVQVLEPGSYQDNNGKVYAYRLITTLTPLQVNP
jgi:hypothetical protein